MSDTLKLLEGNRSYRRFTGRAVTEAELARMVEAASLCGSAGNLQRLRYLPVCGADCGRVFPHLRWAAYLPEWGGPAPDERPTGYLIVLCPASDAAQFNLGIDVGLAAQSMLLVAREMGLGGCMFASADRTALLDAFGLDKEKWGVALVIALGEPLEEVRLVPVEGDNVKYYRDESGVHYVPKRTAGELTVKEEKLFMVMDDTANSGKEPYQFKNEQERKFYKELLEQVKKEFELD